MKSRLRQILKMTVQNMVLPVVYRGFCLQKIQTGMVIIADGHSMKRPERVQLLYEQLRLHNYRIVEWYEDFQSMGYVKALWKMIGFMKLYAQANYVVISDNFLPVSSCNKREGTFVIQLWHGCGAFKKFGYDTPDDIPVRYKGNVFKNYDLVPVSGDKCVEPFTSAMRLPEGVCQPLGVSVTDIFFQESYNRQCNEEFYEKYPQAKGKRIALWAPTFRGSALNPTVCGEEEMKRVQKSLGNEWFFITKFHPHMEIKKKLSDVDIPTERLLPVIDLLITDYSSILFLYAIFDKPMLFFAPDLEEYWNQRGFYLEYETLPGEIAHTQSELIAAIKRVDSTFDPHVIEAFYHEYMSGCDGSATSRILEIMDAKRYKR